MEKALIKHDITLGDQVLYGLGGPGDTWFPDGTVTTLKEDRLITSKGHKYRLTVVETVVDGEPVQCEKFFAVNGGRKWELKKRVDTSGQ